MNSQHRPFHIAAKPAGATCNLDCNYCTSLSKEMLYPGDGFRMSDELLETYIRQLLQAQQLEQVTVSWQGGEPTLMGLPFFQRSIEYVEQYRRPGQSIVYTMRTNGTLLNDDWCAFFKKNNFLLALSVDGPKDMHDAYRVDEGGAGSFDQVMQGLELLHKHQVDVNILCMVHAANADHPLEVYRFFRDQLHARYMQFIPVVERTTAEFLPLANLGWGKQAGAERPLYLQRGSLVTERSVRAEQFGRFLISMFDEWIGHDMGNVFVQTFDVALGSWMGQHSLCIFAPTCGDALALEHNGDLHSCDYYVEPDYRLGNIQETPLGKMVDSESQRAFGRHKLTSLPKYCRECDVLFACYGECPRNRFITAPDGEPGLNYLCAAYKLFFRHIDSAMKLMAGLLKEGPSRDEAIAGRWNTSP